MIKSSSYTGKWTVDVNNKLICFNINDLYTYILTKQDLELHGFSKWVSFLKTKMWFHKTAERSFITAYYEVIGL